ncbi:ABC transporter permease [Caulobacter rhizosphaerae]|jgi:ABC-2 type transport system permease protein|uniref:ABC transporter permease n=1 Tax=Caulobacter rhizosphaerae TaxID=2010972 RepID=UPI0013D0D710|nr:ABC transporter permease [Caulobacter rhizosphaerae]GGL25439.1 ABC transporter [Caulobacter rhizosphaerae]
MTTARHVGAIYGLETHAQLLATSRMPQFLVPSVLLPIIFYAIVGIGLSKGSEPAARWVLSTYVIFAALTPSMFGFGTVVAAEREAKLIELKRVFPMPIGAYLFARMFASVAVVGLALVGVAVLARVAGVQMPIWRWCALMAIGVAAAIPFSLIGLNVGLRLGAQGATAVANLLFLVFSLFGGLWMPLNQLPAWIGKVGWALPSFHFAQLALMLTGSQPTSDVGLHIAILVAMTLAAAVGAWFGWRGQAA